MMKNKNGFTITELVVGIALLSVVTVFMLVVIVDLRNTEQANGIDTKALLLQSVVSSELNKDLNRNHLKEVNALTPDTNKDEVLKRELVFKEGNKETKKQLVLYNKDIINNKAQSIYYGVSNSDVDFRRTLPKNYYFDDIIVSSVGNSIFKKIIISVVHKKNKKLNFTIEAYYYGIFNKDTSEANAPVLQNRIPVYWDETAGTWRITTTKQLDWYNYDKQKWANAISIRPDRAIDYSGNCKPATVVGAPTRNADYISFDGTDDYFKTSINPSDDSNITLSARVRTNNATARGDIIANFENGGVGIYYDYANSRFVGGVYHGGEYMFVYTETVSQNTWYTVTLTYEKKSNSNLVRFRIFLNGKESDSIITGGSMGASSLPLYIGSQPKGTGAERYFKGYISHVIIYQKALGTQEISNKFSSAKFNIDSYPSDATAYYIFDRSEMYGEKVKGMPITLSCGVKSMWVWIPRFKYAVPAGTNEREISVIFENGTAKTGENTTTGARTNSLNNLVDSDYYTHPAFTYNGNEMKGLWVGKFHNTFGSTTPRTTAYNGAATGVYIRPSFVAAVYQRAYWQWQTAILVDTNNDLAISPGTRPIKGTEMGTVIALTMSKYGKYGNKDYTGVNKEVYYNNSTDYYTGRSAGVPFSRGGSMPASNKYGSYNYDNSTISQTDGKADSTLATRTANCSSNGTGCKGTGASSTGTIYGVYDMSGGAYEVLFSVLRASGSVAFTASSTTAGSGYTSVPTSVAVYFDNYSTIANYTNGNLKGDFASSDGTKGWYGDSFTTFTIGSPFRLGGYRTGLSTNNAGIFNNYVWAGTPSPNVSYRIVQPAY